MVRASASGAVVMVLGAGLRARVSGQGEEDVVEVRCVHRELRNFDRVLIEPVQQGPHRFHAAVAWDP